MDQQETDRRFAVLAALGRFGERYRADAEVRARIARGDISDLSGLNLPAEMEFRIVEQTADTYYFPLPPSPGAALSDEALDSVAGGIGPYWGRAGCACVGW